MITGHYFKRLTDPRPICNGTLAPTGAALLSLLARCVIERFVRVGGGRVTANVLVLADVEESDDPPPNPCHPACARYAGSDYCRESWQLHLAYLESRPETHWHQCDYGMLCAVVPVVHQDRALAAVKLNAPARGCVDEFDRQVELLDVLVSDFTSGQTDFLSRFAQAHPVPSGERLYSPGSSPERTDQSHPSHPQVLQALDYIEQHLDDPELTVGHIARELGHHPSYLSKLFIQQIGSRIPRYITDRRMEMARNLLTTTDWQIKQIARQTGFANPNWFSHVFTAQTGLTPGAYRRQSQGRSAPLVQSADGRRGPPAANRPF